MTTVAPTSDNSYHHAVARFSQQTEQLKQLLSEDNGFAVASTDSESEDDEVDAEEQTREEGEDSDSEDGESSSSGGSGSSSECNSSDFDDEDDDDDWDSDLEDLEAVLSGEKAIQPHPITNKSPAMRAMQADLEEASDNILPGILNLKERMRSSFDNLYMQAAVEETPAETVENPFAATSPDTHLKSILEGFSAASFPSNTWHDYFLTMTEEHVEAYTVEVERAIRDQNFALLRDMVRMGHTLQCSNKHGESIVHIACRRGSVELLQFLLNEASVSTRIRDDMGRTPLHDTCWTHKPNFDIVMELLQQSPELLFIVDQRGFTPLHYVPKEAWGVWCEWLQEHRQMLRDMVKSLRFDRARYFVKTMVPCLKF